MSDLSNQAQKLLGGFCQTVDRMRLAYSKNDKMMSVWADDLYAVEAVMSFLETIRDAPAQSGQMSIGEIQSRSYEHGYSDGVEWCTKQLESRAPSPSATEEMENYRMALAYISRQSTDPESRELAETALNAFPSTDSEVAK